MSLLRPRRSLRDIQNGYFERIRIDTVIKTAEDLGCRPQKSSMHKDLQTYKLKRHNLEL
jgi:hypothetical protein